LRVRKLPTGALILESADENSDESAEAGEEAKPRPHAKPNDA
jgi:hypothetical protein